MGEGKARHLQQHDHKPQNRHKPLDAISKRQYFLLQVMGIPINHVDRYNLGTRRGHPAARGGARNAPLSRMSNVTRRSDKITKPMIISLLCTSGGNHANIITTEVHAANANVAAGARIDQHLLKLAGHPSGGENSRRKVQNVVADSTAETRHSCVLRRSFHMRFYGTYDRVTRP